MKKSEHVEKNKPNDKWCRPPPRMEYSSSSIRNACQNPKLWFFYRSFTLILVYKPLCNEEHFSNFTSLLVLIDDLIPPFPQLFLSH